MISINLEEGSTKSYARHILHSLSSFNFEQNNWSKHCHTFQQHTCAVQMHQEVTTGNSVQHNLLQFVQSRALGLYSTALLDIRGLALLISSQREVHRQVCRFLPQSFSKVQQCTQCPSLRSHFIFLNEKFCWRLLENCVEINCFHVCQLKIPLIKFFPSKWADPAPII